MRFNLTHTFNLRSNFLSFALSLTFVLGFVGLTSAQDATTDETTQKRVAIIGATLGQNLFKGLTESPGEGDENFVYLNEIVGSSGIVRDDFFDWPKAIDENLASWNADYLVVLIGSNDNQNIRPASGGSAKPTSEKWLAEYRARVKRIMERATAEGVQVLWVSLPVMKFSRLNRMALQANQITFQEAEANKAHYLDIWDSFSDDQGRYTRRGPDVQGQSRVLRSGDGVHFNKRGRAKLAFYVREKLVELVNTQPSADATVAEGIVDGDLSQEDLAALNEQELDITEEEEVLVTDAPVRKLGPVLSLFPAWQPPKVATPKSSDKGSARHLIYVEGIPLPFVPGRSDDFFTNSSGRLPVGDSISNIN